MSDFAGGLELDGAYLWERAAAQTIDQVSSERYGLAPAVLMETAGKAVAEWLLEADLVDDGPVLVLAGSGHNGGDALVAARWLGEAGVDVHVFTIGSEQKPLCAQQLRTLQLSGYAAEPYTPGCLAAWRGAEPVILDGVYGLGFHGELPAESLAFQALTEAASLPDSTVVALDLPSALDCDLGSEQSLPLAADVTLTFGGNKPALILAPARDHCGEIVVLAVGFPQRAVAEVLEQGPELPAFMLPDSPALIERSPWAKLPRSAHKYDRGHVLIIGGSAGKTGAPMLAALSALRSGAGWASLALPPSALSTLKGEVARELVFEDLFQGSETVNSLALAKFIHDRRVKAVVIGPGTMDNPLTPDSVAELAEFTSHGKGLVVLDAAATSGIVELLQGQDLDPERWLLTPHPGEWTRLGGEALRPPLDASAAKAAKTAAAALGVTLIYKGATPVVVPASLEMPVFVCDAGTVALARAGSGDLFAGAAGAHGAIGCGAIFSALRAQASIAWAARLAAEKVGEHAVLAKDVLTHIGKVPAYIADMTVAPTR